MIKRLTTWIVELLALQMHIKTEHLGLTYNAALKIILTQSLTRIWQRVRLPGPPEYRTVTVGMKKKTQL